MDKHTVHCPNSTFKIIIECAALTKLQYNQDEEAWICAYSDWAYGLFAICGAVILLIPFLLILYCCFKCFHKNKRREVSYDRLVESLSRSTSINPESQRDLSFLPDVDYDFNRQKSGSKDKYFFPYPAYGTDENNSLNGGLLTRYPELTVAHQADMPPQCTTQNVSINPTLSDVTSRMSITYLSSSDPVVSTMLRETQQKLYDNRKVESEEVSSSYPHRKSDDEITRDYSSDIYDDDKNMLLRHQYDNYMCKKDDKEEKVIKISSKNVNPLVNKIDMVDNKHEKSNANDNIDVPNEIKPSNEEPVATLNNEIDLTGSLNNDHYVIAESSSISELEQVNEHFSDVDNDINVISEHNDVCNDSSLDVNNKKHELEKEIENKKLVDIKNENEILQDSHESCELFDPNISEINPTNGHVVDEISNSSVEDKKKENVPVKEDADYADLYLLASTPKALTSKNVMDCDDFLLNSVSSFSDDEKNGTYLIRKSTTRTNCQVIHLYCRDKDSSNISYFTICFNVDGAVFIDNTEIMFDDIFQLLDYYRLNRSILPCVLRGCVGNFS